MASLEEPLKVPMHPAAELGLKCFLAGTRTSTSPHLQETSTPKGSDILALHGQVSPMGLARASRILRT